jgi:hypothetical protein
MRTIDIDIKSKCDVLQGLDLSEADFEGALATALDGLAGTPTDQLPTPRNITISLRGQE